MSISHYSKKNSYLEPPPIPTPSERIATLKKLKEVGATTILTLRPFLPTVELSEYLKILELSKDFTDIVLGEDFYFMPSGKAQQRTFQNKNYLGKKNNVKINQKMPFDTNKQNWNIYHSSKHELAIRNQCKKYGIVFAMRSDEAIKIYQNEKTYTLKKEENQCL